MNKTLLAAALLSLFAANTAFAESGFTVGASAGASQWKVDDASASISKNSTGYKLYAGYGFNPFVGLEGGYVNLGKPTYSSATGGGDLKSDGAYLDLVASLPLPPFFSVFGKVGMYNAKTVVSGSGIGTAVGGGSESSSDIKYGLGAQTMLAPFLRGRVEWERYRYKAFGDSGNIDLFSVGLNFNF